MRNWDGEDVAGAIAAIVVLTILVLLVTYCVMPKHLNSYYLENGATNTAACVKSEWTWEPDVTVFCTDDVNKALDVLQKANASLKK